ncbi:hypothetical protein Poli38472_006991 [Pythium oligandrum]|uniref:NADP-dependent oxidoreductase domain-containing protein n=1 Tax=Pythium oligandrum TaxID=41045 RepID=A0A8K1FDY1_PYTOL|nr:hypothetical protein Poli38472_006991 [Pythium oligandrum]|eukprot:TMW58846.1 hypothetical protein Poli38472_006991 [Pythium oligandrum]
MRYRFLGDSGLLVSVLGLGTWITFEEDDAEAVDQAYALMKHAFTHGVNFFDNAECYGNGQSERVMGRAVHRGIDEGVWTRSDLVLTTKIFMGTSTGPNAHGLSRKHVLEGVKASLQRLELDYVDVVYCHRPDPRTPIEETVRAMNNVIDQGWAFYWGTSEWTSHDILTACEVADRLGLMRPICEQPQYNLFERSKVDVHYHVLYRKYNFSVTTFSPLAYSVLTGKYRDGVPTDSRLASEHYRTFVPEFERRVQQAEQLRPIAEELGCSMGQLALAWCASNPRVASVIMGAKNQTQLDENLGALRVLERFTDELKQRMEAVIPFIPKLPVLDMRYSTMRDHYFTE